MSLPLLTVTQLNTYIKSLFDGDAHLCNVFLCGEISNFTNHYRTGHYYMTIKDAGASIKAVMFRSSNQRLRFMPENGMSIIARGRVSVFERDGQYQLYIDDMQPDGIGALNVAFEQLKAKLSAQGLFDSERKKALPDYPMRVGVVTSPTGAAVRDIINVLGRRFPIAEIILCPVQVQGAIAAPQIVDAISRLNRDKLCDVMIVGRGGGSLEELWAFNEEIVARAVASSDIPVISAVGHETDFTICDFAADLRAPTPSAAAELAVPDWREQKAYLNGCFFRMKKTIEQEVAAKRLRLRELEGSQGLSSKKAMLENYRLILDRFMDSMIKSVSATVKDGRSKIVLYSGKLDALSPLKVLSRGYAIACSEGKAVTAVSDISVGCTLEVRLTDGTAQCTIDSIKGDVSGNG